MPPAPELPYKARQQIGVSSANYSVEESIYI